MSHNIRIGYVNHEYPVLTETFVYREVLGLQQAGLHVATFAVWKPDETSLSQESKDMVASTTYVFPTSWANFFGKQLSYLVRHPRKYLETFAFVMTRKGESFSNRRRTFYHFCEAAYLADEVKRQKIDHVHAHFSINAATVALVLARLLDISFSFTAHNNLFYDQLILKEKVKEAKFVIVVSEYNRRFINKLMGRDDDNHKMHTVHYGLSVNSFVPPAAKPNNPIPIILLVSQLAERKGTPYLVKACKILKDRGLKFRCIIAGEGPERPIIEDLIAQNDLAGEVEMVGAVYQEQLRQYLNQADIFTLPCIVASNGDIDGIPNVLMEAMATEIPVISTYVSGIPELIENEECGLLVNEKDETALAEALQRLLENPTLRAELGRRGRQKVIQEFNIDRNAERLASLFERYVQHPAKPPVSTTRRDWVEQQGKV
ncbi:MAG: glycosyltransferase family 4 protein [Anaerolineae bacterium]|nr:glycosyltransferase family 4 protein [Anaerolineae bacterium]